MARESETEARVEITEQELDGQTIYHWIIYDANGNEFSHSAYHTDRAACESEGRDRLAHAQSEGWL